MDTLDRHMTRHFSLVDPLPPHSILLFYGVRTFKQTRLSYLSNDEIKADVLNIIYFVIQDLEKKTALIYFVSDKSEVLYSNDFSSLYALKKHAEEFILPETMLGFLQQQFQQS